MGFLASGKSLELEISQTQKNQIKTKKATEGESLNRLIRRNVQDQFLIFFVILAHIKDRTFGEH